MKNKYFKLITIIISGILISILYKNINFVEFIIIFQESNKSILLAGIFISFLLGFIGGFRYSFFARYFKLKPSPNFITSTKSYFISSSFNLLLPSKLGDLTKGFICSKLDKINYNKSLFYYTIYEKLSDFFALTFIILILYIYNKIFISFDNSNLSLILDFIEKTRINYLLILCNLILFFFLSPISKTIFKNELFIKILNNYNNLKNFTLNLNFKEFINYQSFAVLLWILHLFQISLFAESLNINLLSFDGFLSIGIVIIFGLLPLSFAGIGTRDALLLFIFSNSYGNVKPLFLGVLMTLRYILPAFIGLINMRELTK